MKIGERGRVTIPKEIRTRFGLGPETEVEFELQSGSIVLKNKLIPNRGSRADFDQPRLRCFFCKGGGSRYNGGNSPA